MKKRSRRAATTRGRIPGAPANIRNTVTYGNSESAAGPSTETLCGGGFNASGVKKQEPASPAVTLHQMDAIHILEKKINNFENAVIASAIGEPQNDEAAADQTPQLGDVDLRTTADGVDETKKVIPPGSVDPFELSVIAAEHQSLNACLEIHKLLCQLAENRDRYLQQVSKFQLDEVRTSDAPNINKAQQLPLVTDAKTGNDVSIVRDNELEPSATVLGTMEAAIHRSEVKLAESCTSAAFDRVDLRGVEIFTNEDRKAHIATVSAIKGENIGDVVSSSCSAMSSPADSPTPVPPTPLELNNELDVQPTPALPVSDATKQNYLHRSPGAPSARTAPHLERGWPRTAQSDVVPWAGNGMAIPPDELVYKSTEQDRTPAFTYSEPYRGQAPRSSFVRVNMAHCNNPLYGVPYDSNSYRLAQIQQQTYLWNSQPQNIWQPSYAAQPTYCAPAMLLHHPSNFRTHFFQYRRPPGSRGPAATTTGYNSSSFPPRIPGAPSETGLGGCFDQNRVEDSGGGNAQNP